MADKTGTSRRLYMRRRRDVEDRDGWTTRSHAGGDSIALTGRVGPWHGSMIEVLVELDGEWLDSLARARAVCTGSVRSAGHCEWHMDHPKNGPCEGEHQIGKTPVVADEVSEEFRRWREGLPGGLGPEVEGMLLSCWQVSRGVALRDCLESVKAAASKVDGELSKLDKISAAIAEARGETKE